MAVIGEDEVYFPRGGANNQNKKSIKSDRTYIFESKKPERVPKKKPGRKERLRENAKKITLDHLDDVEDDDLSEADNLHTYDVFTYKSLRDGTLSMCSIIEVCNNYFTVSLPERLVARVPFALVSEPLKKLLDENPSKFPDLKKYFPTGYCLPCKITEVSKNSEYYNVTASTDPSLVNSYVSFNLVCVGFTFIAAVQSCEDHGYVMNTGIIGLNAFLPHSKIGNYLDEFNSGMTLGIGQLVWCKVVKSTLSERSNMVELTIDPEQVSNAKLKTLSSPEILIPGVQVNVTVTKVTPKVIYVNEVTTEEKGYIPTSQLDNVWSKISDYQIGSELSVSVLYKFPLINAVCYSLMIKPNTICSPEIKKGTVFNRAKIISKDGRGVFVQLEDNNDLYKGIIPTFKLKKTMDESKIDELFPLGNHITVRVLNYYNLDRIYCCSSSDEILQKGGHLSEYQGGQLVDVKITKKMESGILGTIGNTNVRAFIPLCHVTDSVCENPAKKIIVDEIYNGRVLMINESKNSVVVTLCPSLVNNKPLKSFKFCKIGAEYYGIIRSILNNGIVVTFFNDLKAVIAETELQKSPLKYKSGEVVKCYCTGIGKDGSPRFSLTKPLDVLLLKIGYSYPIMVKAVSEKGLSCIVLEHEQSVDCSVPTEHLSDCLKLCPALLKNYEIGKQIDDAILYSYEGKTPIFSLKYSVKVFFEKNEQIKENGISALKKNDSIPATIHSVNNDSLLLYVPVPQYNGKVRAEIPKSLKTSLFVNQGVDVIVTNVIPKSKDFSVKINPSVNVLTHVKKELQYFLKELSNHISRTPGDTMIVKVTGVDKNSINVSLPDKSVGIISRRRNQKFKVGAKITAIYLYEDLLNSVSHLCFKSDDLCKGEVSDMRIVHLTNDFCIGITLSSHKVIFLNPINESFLTTWKEKKNKSLLQSNVHIKAPKVRKCGKFYHGIVQWNSCLEFLLKKSDKKTLKKKENISEDEEVEEEISDSDDNLGNSDEENSLIKSKNEPRKRKSSEENNSSDEVPSKKAKRKSSETEKDGKNTEDNKKKKKNKKSLNESDLKVSNVDVNKNKKKRSHDSVSADGENSKISKFTHDTKLKESKAAKNLKEKKLKELEGLSLENIGGFDWNATPSDLAQAVSMGKLDIAREDSDDEVVVKKKLTPAERKAAKFEAERKIREKEEELLRCEENPQSADHFDRLLLARPNDSKLWIQYMAFHLQATDIDKARSIARRAIKQINLREEQERLNVWIALLNLENLYGTSETFDQTLAEALKYNDDFEVYMKALVMYCDSERVADLEKLTNHLVRKFKDKTNCWLECQSALMKVGLTDKARTFLQRSLSSLPLKEHINLISRFALLENKYGFHEQAQSLFENLLTSYPQRIDLWNVYIDMLVKSNLIDLARNVLERIQSHKLPVRKMRAVYKKWLMFEEKYGTEKSVERVRKAAEEYVSDILVDKNHQKKIDKKVDESVDDSDDDDEEEEQDVAEEVENEEEEEDDDDDDGDDE